jgi:uncharacterized protein (DUF1330 family)
MAVELCVLLWAKTGNVDALVAYEDKVLDLVADHGGVVRQRARVAMGDADDPTEVQLLHFPTMDAFDAYMQDERRLALASARDNAIERTQVMRVELHRP